MRATEFLLARRQRGRPLFGFAGEMDTGVPEEIELVRDRSPGGSKGASSSLAENAEPAIEHRQSDVAGDDLSGARRYQAGAHRA